jgi:hypothetical protein
MIDSVGTQKTNRQAIKIGTNRDVDLSPDLRRTLHRVYSVVGPYQRSALEEFELNFRRELSPDREIRIWSQMASAFERFKEVHPAATHDELTLALQALVLISSGTHGHSKVPDALFEELLGLYASL